MKRVLFTALLLSVFALAAEVPAFNAEKAAGKGAVFRDGVFTVETTKPSKYANMSFSLGDMPYRTDLQLEFEYRSTVLTGGPERYIGVNFSPRKMPKTVTMPTAWLRTTTSSSGSSGLSLNRPRMASRARSLSASLMAKLILYSDDVCAMKRTLTPAPARQEKMPPDIPTRPSRPVP